MVRFYWPYFPLEGGRRRVDYILDTKEAIKSSKSVQITPFHNPCQQHTITTTCFQITSPFTITYFNHELAETYSQHLQQGFHHLDPTRPLDALTSQLSIVVHTSTMSSSPYQTPSKCHLPRNMVNMPQLVGMMRIIF